MKRKRLLFLLLFALMAPWAANAQTTVTIGEGTATCNTNPIGTYYNYSISEQLYTAEEIGIAGTISSISFYYMGIAAKNLPITVYMANVDAADLSTGGISLADADEVFSGTLPVTTTAGWVTINLANPFAYDGSSNLLIGFIKDYLYYFSGQSWQGTATTATMARYTQSDSAGPYTTSTVPSSAQANRPNIQMVITPSSGPVCNKPSTLDVTDITGAGATCTWENTGAASYTFEWKKASASDWTVVTGLTANTYEVSGLEPFTAYSVRVKAVCDTDLESGYKSASFTTLDVCPDGKVCIGEGTATNSYLPGYTYYNYTLTQQIYTAEEIGGAGLIESIDFYCSSQYSRTWDLYMVNTEKDAFADGTDWITVTSADLVYSGSVTFAQGWNTLTLNNPFIFMGRTNVALIVDDNTGSWVSAPSFYVFNTTESQAIYVYSDGTNYDPMNPPTSYTTSEYHNTLMVKNRVRLGVSELPSCFQPSGLTVSNIEARQAVLSWTENGEATAWEVEVTGDYTTTWDATTNPYTLVGLEPETNYSVRVRANCGDSDYSEWTAAVTFTTDVSCHAPTDMVISDITAYTANVAWTSDNTNFDMRYTTDLDPNNDFETSNLRGWTNIDADGDGYEWVLGSQCGGVYLAEGGSLAGTGHNSSADMVTSGSYSNVSGGALTPDNYLVSPQITLGGSISFWACAQDGSWAAEHFGVAVSTTGNTDPADFTTIAEWTFGSRSANVLRSSNAPRGGNRAQSDWVQYTVDLSAYSGRGYVAIRHFNCTDQFMLNVDDIVIEQPGGFQVNWTDVPNPTNPQALTNLDDATLYVVQVRANCGGDDGVSRWLEGMFTTLPSCMVPTNLVISNIDKRSADLAWTPNGEETAWQICVNGDMDNLIDVTATTYSFTGLEPETRYTVKVRAYCDETLQSAWSSPAVFTTLVACPAPTGLAISDITNVSAVATWTYDGDVELEYAEDVWKYYDNGIASGSLGYNGTFSWAIMLTPDMLPASQPLTHVAVYENQNNTLPIKVSFYSGGNDAPGTLLYTEDVTPVGNGFHEFALDEPVTFDATQNLWIVCFSEDQYPAVASTNTGTTNGGWVSLDSGTTWDNYSSSYNWMIRAAFGNNTTEWVAVNNPASPQTIAGLTPETNYMVRLRAVCGGIDGESVWVTTSFTTDIACPAPYALAATPYANSAVLSWEGISESYTVSYRTAAYTQGISEEFATSSAPTGWTMYTGLLSNVMEDPTALVSTTYGWTFGTGNGVFDSHARCNIYSNYQRWLVTPAMEVPTGASFSFDMALTVYSSSSSASPTPGSQADDKFIVLVSTDNMATWTILRQWDNAGSEYVYDNITNNANGEHVSFDFGAYAGQTVKIAFYGESTVSGGDNNLHIDNVAIGTAVPAGEWMTVDADEATATLTGLTPATKYEWKVQGDCGDFGMSEESAISSFTTTEDTCPMPTNLTVDAETLTFNTADLSWNGSPDVESFTVRYRAPEHAAAGGFYEPFNNSGVPAGWTRYSGLVDDVVAGTTTLSSTTSGWIFSNTNVFGEYHAKVNIYGTGCKYWLVTPEVTPTSGTFSFDLALTDYSNADPIEDPTAQADDRFVVLVYADSTWTILREWNNSGSDYVYNNIATTGEHVNIDLSDYVGQAVQIAFYGESTVSSNGDNDLHIDNVLIGEMIPATDWQMVEGITDMNVTLTGLTPETLYEAQVKSDCSDPEAWSNSVSFTTLVQTTVTQTIELSEGWNYVSVNVDVTLDDLKAALVATGNTAITIKSQNKTTTYVPRTGRWNGALTWNVAEMYKIKVGAACEIALEGMPLDPTEHPVSIVNGANWIGFPLFQSMTPANAFAGFAVNGDVIKSQNGTSTYVRGRWNGGVSVLVPGQGYIYKSSNTQERTLVFPSDAK